ncbi:hypothetical protein CIG75_19250 [Tumebacillus algifaecis]|uniref:Uncharacterized protein n=1 Tax=Tumebacillus algifaecis TaxID=1214604 RepID=A0A223D5M7_9BACL|nr:helix-turn-helix domain-containing protein [Tumebacillus algifaecis]ASS76871.1 hypothetical protein CIG75_19250 [Tumebacillus algifaecis]
MKKVTKLPNLMETAMTTEELIEILPVALTPNHMMELFGLSRQTAYDLWELPDFPGFRVGVRKLVTCEALLRYMKFPSVVKQAVALREVI